MKKITQEEFIKSCREKHLDQYDYSKTIYTLKHEKVIITCKIHGDFLQQAHAHKRGQGCIYCNNLRISKRCRKTLEKFIEEANIVHNNFYNYSKFNYLDAHSKSEIICDLHGSFLQDAHSHLKGSKCSKCALEQSDKWGWSKSKWLKIAENKIPKLYIIRVFNDQENFIKVGITTKEKVEYRLKQIPYKYEILEIIENNGEYIWELENLIKKQLRKDNKYIPLIKFKGENECYQLNSLQKIKDLCHRKKLEWSVGTRVKIRSE